MNIFVTIRQTTILRTDPVLSADGLSMDTSGLKRHINEWDLYALEEGLRLKDEHGGSVTVVSIGDQETEDAAYYSLAAGADDVIWIKEPSAAGMDAWQIAFLLSRALEGKSFDLILSGVQSEDQGRGEVGVLLAQLLGIPQAAAVFKIRSIAPGQSVEVQRELEDGLYDVRKCSLPALLSVQTGINQPRYVSSMRLRNIRKKSNIKAGSLQDLHVDGASLSPRKTVRRLSIPEVGSAKLELIEGADPGERASKLLDKLTEREVF